MFSRLDTDPCSRAIAAKYGFPPEEPSLTIPDPFQGFAEWEGGLCRWSLFGGTGDNDGDGIEDALEPPECVGVRGGPDGCPSTDADGDGVPNRTDLCPTVANATSTGCSSPETECFSDPTTPNNPFLPLNLAFRLIRASKPAHCLTRSEWEAQRAEDFLQKAEYTETLFKSCVIDPTDAKSIAGFVGENLPLKRKPDANKHYKSLYELGKAAKGVLRTVNKLDCGYNIITTSSQALLADLQEFVIGRRASNQRQTQGPIAQTPAMPEPPSFKAKCPKATKKICKGLAGSAHAYLVASQDVAQRQLAVLDSANRAGAPGGPDFNAHVMIGKVHLVYLSNALDDLDEAAQGFAGALQKAKLTGTFNSKELREGASRAASLDGLSAADAGLMQGRGLPSEALRQAYTQMISQTQLPAKARYLDLVKSRVPSESLLTGFRGGGITQLVALVDYLARNGVLTPDAQKYLQVRLDAIAAACSVDQRDAFGEVFKSSVEALNLPSPYGSYLQTALNSLNDSQGIAEPFSPSCP